MNRLRYPAIAFAGLLVGITVWAAVRAASVEHPQPTSDVAQPVNTSPLKSTALKTALPNDPKEREIVLRRLKDEFAARQAQRIEENRRRALQWRGCKFVPSAKPDDQEAFAQQKQIADLFAAKEPIPQGRTDKFRDILSLTEFRCVGWEGTVASVVSAEGGKKIELLVRPSLAAKGGGGIVFTPCTCRETWRLDSRNELSCEKIEVVPGIIRGVFVD